MTLRAVRTLASRLWIEPADRCLSIELHGDDLVILRQDEDGNVLGSLRLAPQELAALVDLTCMSWPTIRDALRGGS